MKRKLKNVREIKLICPESSRDIEDIIEILQERETSVLVNMSKCNFPTKGIIKIMDYILSCQKSYMSIKVKKIFPKVFVCYSKHPELYI